MNFAAWFSSFFLFLGVLTNRILAQDFKFRPERQQIPTPGCLVMKGAWKAALRPAHRTSTMRGWPISGIRETNGGSVSALEIVSLLLSTTVARMLPVLVFGASVDCADAGTTPRYSLLFLPVRVRHTSDSPDRQNQTLKSYKNPQFVEIIPPKSQDIDPYIPAILLTISPA